ncbi:hypothetical protein EMPS_02639 [Entomortierella parvispora]|uniref:F-box domain-containing protein n=1 Tax=Entomortierella parvispora TaxID=205924 RepID=A0A9P3H544_9FUNG|nr:hypothetical protein EMPS_02639 [Entomortierella parvispora]
MHDIIPGPPLLEACAQDSKTSTQTLPSPLTSRRRCVMDRVLGMPELVHAMAQYFIEPDFRQMSLVCQLWHSVWSPYQWRALSLSTRPPFPPSNDPSTAGAGPDILSKPGLARYGSRVLQLKAPWLTADEFQALSLHCPCLQELTIAHFELPRSLFGPMLSRWRELRALSLEVGKDDDLRSDGEGSAGLLRTIAQSALHGLECIELTFQWYVKMDVDLIFTVLKSYPLLKTFKLTDADIIATQSISGKLTKGSHRHGKGKEVIGVHDPSNGSSAGSTGINAQRKQLAKDYEQENTSLEHEPEWVDAVGSFGLRCLCISSSYISDSTLELILECCPRLESIQLHSCNEVTDQTLSTLARLNRRLRRLSLSACRSITSQGLIELFAGIEDMTQIHLCDLSLIRDDCLEALAKHHGHSLQRVNIYFSALLTERGIMSILTGCRNLRVLGFQAYGSSIKLFEVPWASNRTLERLDLQSTFKGAVASLSLLTDTADPDGSRDVSTLERETEGNHLENRQNGRRGFMAMAIGELLSSLPRLWDLGLQAKGMERAIIEGLNASQRIRVLHFYGLQSIGSGSVVGNPIPWRNLRKGYPHLRRFACGALGAYRDFIKEELAKVDIEFLPSSAVSNMAFE